MLRRAAYSTLAIFVLLAVDSRGQVVQHCVSCDRALFGEYLEVDGQNYHSSCFKCAECGKPINGNYCTHLSGYFHGKCYDERFRSPCMACGRLIADKFYEDYWGGRYCAGHLDVIPVCDFCGRLVAGPITGNELRLPDGRRLCGVCRPSAVTSETRAEELMCEVATRMRSFGLTVDCSRVTMLLLGQDKLKLLVTDPRHALLGFTEYIAIPNEGGRAEIQSFNIFLLYGMPAIQAKRVLAHELMHVWLFDDGISDIDATLCEGSCDYASYLFLKSVGSIECNYIMRNMFDNLDLDYGRGFRDVKQYAETNGVAAWLQMLREREDRGRRLARQFE
jgi:hypothetical protein